MKIYTKKGDQGETSLIGGTRVLKNHERIEAYGTVDELNSWIGLIRDQDIAAESIAILVMVQDRLFTIGSLLAEDPGKSRMKLPPLQEADTLALELEMDRMNEELPEMRSFVLPGGHTAVSYCHIGRCVCRRAERIVIGLAETNEVDGNIVKYLNRLSDYLFVLSRKVALDLKADEIPWNPKF